VKKYLFLLILVSAPYLQASTPVMMEVRVQGMWEGHWNVKVGSVESLDFFGYGNTGGLSVSGISGASQTFQWSPNADFSAPVYTAYLEVRDMMLVSLNPDGTYAVILEGDPGGDPIYEELPLEMTLPDQISWFIMGFFFASVPCMVSLAIALFKRSAGNNYET